MGEFRDSDDYGGTFGLPLIPEDLLDEEAGLVERAAEFRRARQSTLGELFSAKPATPERLGLTLADWDFPEPELADWVSQDGRPWTLRGMGDDHLANTFRYLARRHGDEFLRHTPLGRAMLAVLATRGVTP